MHNEKELMKKALLEIRNLKERLRMAGSHSEPAAVTGMSCRLPGGIRNTDDYWDVLWNGKDVISEVPDDRWNEYDKEKYLEDDRLKKAGFLADSIEEFDNRLFRMLPGEAASVDPQQRIALEVCWEALENAGYAPDSLKGKRVGVFAGAVQNDFGHENYMHENNDEINITGIDHSFLSGRISYFFGFSGPSISIDTACSSSAVAIDTAIKYLRDYDCDIAVVVGVNIMFSPESTKKIAGLGILSSDGEVRAFAENASGTVRGEGAAAIVLKRLSDAEKDGDRISSLILGSSVNQDGASSGLTAPNGSAQTELLKTAWKKSGIDASDLGYIETHGTGTELGDPIEAKAIAEALGERKSPVFIGSVKTNIGHLEGAAGIAGIIKTSLMLERKKMPASLHFDKPSGFIDWNRIPVRVASERSEWNTGERERIAGVSSFGLSGTNVHIVMKEYRSVRKNVPGKMPVYPFVFTAPSADGVIRNMRGLLGYLNKGIYPDMTSLSYSWNTTRAKLSNRSCITVSGRKDLEKVLKEAVSKGHSVSMERAVAEEPVKTVFLFTGQGSQYSGMCKTFYDKVPVFRETFDLCAKYYNRITCSKLYDIVFSGDYDLKRTVYTQPALFACEYSLAKMWISLGLKPDTVIGHSIGEYAAACIAGVMTPEDAVKLVTLRGQILEEYAVKGRMAAIFAGREKTAELISDQDEVFISLSNSRSQTVIAGTEEKTDAVLKKAEQLGIRFKVLRTSRPFHTPLLKKAAEKFRKAASEVKFSLPSIEIISNISGRPERERIASLEYWAEHILSEVHFCESIENLGDNSGRIFVETGPEPVLSGIVENITGGTAVCIHSADMDCDAEERIPSVITSAFLHGAECDIRKAYVLSGASRCAVPNYSFDKRRIPFIHTFAERSSVSVAADLTDENEKYTSTDKSEILRSLVADFTGVSENEITDDTNLLKLGIDSVSGVRLITKIYSVLKVKLPVEQLFDHCRFGEIVTAVKNASGEEEKKKDCVKTDEEKRYEPFALNDVQYAYWAGRDNPNMLLSGKACCAYFEGDIENLDTDRFAEAVRKLEERHDMLRCRITEDAVQYIERESHPDIRIYDNIPANELSDHLETVKNEMSGMIIPLGDPMYQIRLTHLNDNCYRMHFYIDFMIADAASLYIIINDLEKLYNGDELKPLEITYRDYLEFTRENEELMATERSDEEFWSKKAENFPKAPELPYISSEFVSGADRTFIRRRKNISKEKWKQFSENAAEYGLTPSAALFSLYSEVLSAFGGGSSFAVMLTVFRRHDISPDIGKIVGDFTRLAPVEVNRKNVSIAENALAIQKTMHENIAHADYSAVEFTDKLRKLHQDDRMYNVIFTSAVGVRNDSDMSGSVIASKLRSIVSSTPQVCLDHQVFYENEDTVISWDTPDSVFAEGVVDAMFEVYTGLIERASDDKKFFSTTLTDLRPASQRAVHLKANSTEITRKETILTEGFEKNASEHPERTALITGGKSYSYGELNEMALKTASLLHEKGAKKGDRILIDLPKSFEQIYAVTGVLLAGCVYVPLTHDQPVARTKSIIEKAAPFAIITNRNTDELVLETVTPEMIKSCSGNFEKTVITPEDGAYIIYTSGSTGVPKGVYIAHGSAMNTVTDVNSRYGINEKDRAIGVSALSFDLSVYDIFGMFTAGGALVLPTEEQRIDPKEQYALVSENGVTVWNSVPALMDIFTDHLKKKNIQNSTIRKVILSGDWIPMTLPEKIKQTLPSCKLTSMGGATEASVWSNYFDVHELKENWKSVPYGYPLANQRFYIFDEFGRKCPDRVSGRLHIAGRGLAECYYNEKEITERSFYYSSAAGERVYDTGDYGRYIEDGIIEFLGRKDGQVKINGYRIETAEIESAFRKCGIRERIFVLPVGDRAKKIAAFIETSDQIDASEIKKSLMAYLPDYFLPENIFAVDRLPVTGNGKVDSGRLTAIYHELSERISENDMTDDNADPVLLTIRNILGINNIHPSDNFGRLGVSSVEMIHLADELESVYGIRPSITKMLNSRSVSEITAMFADAADKKEEALSSEKRKVVKRVYEDNSRYDPVKKYRDLGIELFSEGEKLKFRAAKGALTDELLAQIKSEKSVILKWLDSEKERLEKLEKYYSENAYPLTPVQKAYLLGRSSDYELGGTSAHYYAELEWNDLDVAKLEEAVNTMIDNHDILQSVVLDDGTQVPLEEVPYYRIVQRKLTLTELEKYREENKAFVYETGKWPMFDVSVSRTDDSRTVVHFSFDCMLLDGWSANMMISQIYSLYSGKKVDFPDYTFRQYVLEKDEWLKQKDYYREACEYWEKNSPLLPPAPALPYRVSPDSVKKPHFSRKRYVLDRDLTLKLNERLKVSGVTASAAVCTAYMKIISEFGGSEEFSLNLTLYNRLPLNREVSKLLGDFTNLTLVPYHAEGSFIKETEEVHDLLMKAAEYRTYNGLDLLKRFSGNNIFSAVMPVVFTSELFGNLDSAEDDEVFSVTKELYAISQTPQVALDHQALVRNGELVLIWDYVEELFEPDKINEMFETYVSFIRKLALSDNWNEL